MFFLKNIRLLNMSQNGQAHFKNLATFAARYLGALLLQDF